VNLLSSKLFLILVFEWLKIYAFDLSVDNKLVDRAKMGML